MISSPVSRLILILTILIIIWMMIIWIISQQSNNVYDFLSGVKVACSNDNYDNVDDDLGNCFDDHGL